MGGIQAHWERITPISALLYAPSLVFRAAVAARRIAYGRGLLRVQHLTVPVIVVGNITVGGTGKTPLVLWLASHLLAHGLNPGIVSRGYGARTPVPRTVLPESNAAAVGDEPLLLARRSGCPVWIGADRVAAARALLASHPQCDVIVSDDGLQHLRLGRDMELAVLDGARGLGNGFMLPAGPLREPSQRLASVDAVVVNGAAAAPPHARACFHMRLRGGRFHNLVSGEVAGPERFAGKRVYAVAGIGHPQRFFSHLRALGLAFEARGFPDHHRYAAQDLAFAGAEAVLMTEKDAVKCAPFASEAWWALRVDADPDPGLGELVIGKLRKR